MGQSYYYFTSTLPMVQFGRKPHLSVEDFLSDCQRLLTVEDNAFIQKLLAEDGDDIPTDNELLKRIVKFNQSYHNILVTFRAQRTGKDPVDYVKGERYQNPYLVEVVQRASKESDLLSAEKMLDETKWKFLEDMVVGHQHDVAFLCVYGLQLKIAQRHAEINSPKGSKMFEKYEMFDLSGESFLTIPEHRS